MNSYTKGNGMRRPPRASASLMKSWLPRRLVADLQCQQGFPDYRHFVQATVLRTSTCHQGSPSSPASWAIPLTTFGALRLCQFRHRSSPAITMRSCRESRPGSIRRSSRSLGLFRVRPYRSVSGKAKAFCGSKWVVPIWGHLESRAQRGLDVASGRRSRVKAH